MRIACIGGGPAGLYFSILMKKAAPAADITVVERNAPGVTFGWGVVFSDETLGYLAENDAETHAAIRRAFVHWDAIDIFYRGTVVRSGGHGFSGIARRELLRLLQDRCAALGVKLAFQREVDDLDAFCDADLVVAADGVNSKTRKAREAVFRPSIKTHDARYIWLGTRRRFDAFTFIFEENDDGIFQVHAYGFDAETSTFIVECDERSWRNAGLDRKTTEESIAYLERLFARHLDGHRLLANNASWIQFLTVKNEAWRDGRVVLMGDAAHTAHFSIGSGTKLAMEDAIALAGACARSGSIDDALARYEAERRPIVERTQRAAEDSLTWFENVRGHAQREPHDFAFSLLTRSKRVTYEKLRERDPRFVDAITASFAARAEGAAARAPGEAPPAPMRTAFALRDLLVANRVVARASRAFAAHDGAPGDDARADVVELARAGAGLVLAGPVAVSPEGRPTDRSAGMYRAEHAAAWRAVVDEVRRASRAAIGITLAHAGPAEVLRIGDFARAAQMAADAGFDLVEIAVDDGDVLESFLLEVAAGVRAAWPSARPMGVRVATRAALSAGAAVALARALRERGCDLVEIAHAAGRGGGHASSPFDDRTQHHVDIAMLAAGPATTSDQVNTLVASRRADLCVVDLANAPTVRDALAARA